MDRSLVRSLAESRTGWCHRNQEKKHDAMDIKTDEGIGLKLGSGRRAIQLGSSTLLVDSVLSL